MYPCTIYHDQGDTIDTLRFEGALDAQSFTRLETAFNKLLTDNRFYIVLDCSGLDYINSASLGALIGFARRVREKGGDLKLAALSGKIHAIVTLLGFDQILKVYDDPATAAADFDMP